MLSTKPRCRVDIPEPAGTSKSDAGTGGVDPGWTLKQYKFIMDNLREVRESCGISLLEFSHRIGTGPTPARKWELYGAMPFTSTLPRIGAVLHALRYTPVPDPDGWTIDYAMEQAAMVSADFKTCRILQVSTQTVRGWWEGRYPGLDTLIRLQEMVQGK